MARFEDDEERDVDRYDDRPRRRNKSGSNTTLILGIVGGVILVVVLGCGGLIFWAVSRTVEGVKEFGTTIGGTMAAEAWMEDLKAGNSQQAYNATSSDFKATYTQAEFERLLEKHPALTRHTFRSNNSFNSTQVGSNQSVVIRMRLHTSGLGEDEDDEDSPTTKKQPNVKKPKKVNIPEIDVTLTLVNEGGVWKVSSITIP